MFITHTHNSSGANSIFICSRFNTLFIHSRATLTHTPTHTYYIFFHREVHLSKINQTIKVKVLLHILLEMK